MTYKDLFYGGVEGEKIFLEILKCCFVIQMNHRRIAITKNYI